MAHITPSSNLPQADSAPSTTNVRRLSHLQAKLTAVEPQTHLRLDATPKTSSVSNNKNQNNSGNYISSMTHEEAAETLLMFKLYPRVKGIYELLPYSAVSAAYTTLPNTLTKQSHNTGSEKENVVAPLVKTTTAATQVATTTTTPPLNGQPSKSKKKTDKRAHKSALKRKAAALDALETTGSVPHVQKTEPRAIKRLRTKFVADPSDRVTRSSKSKVEVEGAGANRTPAQKDSTDEQATATTSTDNTVNSSAEYAASSIGPVVESKALNDNSAQRPGPTSVILARGAFAAADTVATTNNNTPAVEPAVTLKDAEVGPKVLDSAEKERSVTPKIRVPGGKSINATV